MSWDYDAAFVERLRSLPQGASVLLLFYRSSLNDQGTKLAIEALLESQPRLVAPEEIGRSRKIEDARGRYIHAAKLTFPPHLRLDGLKIVVDCAHGAAYQVAPAALWELGADVIPIGVAPNGININECCGSTDTGLLRQTVLDNGADVGRAADRPGAVKLDGPVGDIGAEQAARPHHQQFERGVAAPAV